MANVTAASPGKPAGYSIWVAFLGAPILWFAQFQLNYALVLWVCKTGRVSVLHLSSGGFFLAAAACGAVSWYNWRRAGREWPDASAGPLPRTRFMAVVGLLNTVLFCLLIAAQSLANFLIDPCAF